MSNIERGEFIKSFEIPVDADVATLGISNFERGYFYKAYEVHVDADLLVDMLADWVNLYLPHSFPVKLHPVYGDGSGPGKYPCQRIVHIDHATVPTGQHWPKYFVETLHAVNFDTRTLIYSVDQGGGSLNYFAANEVEELGSGLSRLAFRARFDLPPGADTNAFIEHVTGPMPMLVRGLEENAADFLKNRRPQLLKARLG